MQPAGLQARRRRCRRAGHALSAADAFTSRLFARADLLPGNLAKVRVVAELARRLDSAPDALEVLDVGCVGPTPFNQWRYLFAEYPGRIRLTGIDVRGLDRARQAAREAGWSVDLRELSAYEMTALGRTFDVVVSTQVLEHLRRPSTFLEQLARVLRPGGTAYVTLDSGHFHGGHGLRERLRDLLAPVLGERYHDKGLRRDEVTRLVGQAGLRVDELRLHNLGPLKGIHNHELSAGRRDLFLARWWELEDMLQDDATFVRDHPDHFRGLYLRIVHGA